MPSFTPNATAVQEILKSIAHNDRPVRFGASFGMCVQE